MLESSDALGQLGSPIVHEGLRIDRFSNALRNTDTALCGLLASLALFLATTLRLGGCAWLPSPGARLAARFDDAAGVEARSAAHSSRVKLR